MIKTSTTLSSCIALIALCLPFGSGAHAAVLLFTSPNAFSSSTVIDFEPTGSGSTLSAINTHLSTIGAHAVLSFSGGGAQIANLTASTRAAAHGVAPGADGGPVSGQWGFEGGDGAASILTLTFSPGSFPDAVGAYWGGVVALSVANITVTLDDGTVVTTPLSGQLPAVPDTASNAQAINGFLGIGGSGHTIKSATFTARSDLFSIDDVRFGALPSPVPEPTTFAIFGIGLFALLRLSRHR